MTSESEETEATTEAPPQAPSHAEDKDEADKNVEYFQSLADKESFFVSPINLNISQAQILQLPNLTWSKHDAPPKKVKITNTGTTLNISANWIAERPCLFKGPFQEKYVFSQIHFHWGENVMEGSEHTADGVRYPLEMHVVYYKSSYQSQEAALQHHDGIAILVYLFQLQDGNNHSLQVIVDIMQDLVTANTSQKLPTPLPLNFIVKEFSGDYLLYWGTVTTSDYNHLVMWLVSREPFGIALEQMDIFRTLLNKNGVPLLRNFRETQLRDENTKVFFVNPSPSRYATLLQVYREFKLTSNSSTLMFK